ncbi:hypothetical protein [Natrinema halophilum]|uniref:Methanogenesis regulatory protein FilR1 middle domain-containing protein n=1 Tax=Natrinema halophilum TaxID=1699371 RepID=A0A7D5K605_9EURY|nr:hypothetical protein [Natrinema halophilum]QLG48823.1 hypothetical protein HYG82_08165 [Natrinema halophilum]
MIVIILLAGTCTRQARADYYETVRITDELSDFLQYFPIDESAPDFLALTDAEVTSSSNGDPYAPARKQTEILRTADRLQFFLLSIDFGGTKMITEQVTQHGLEVETVVTPTLEATIESDQYASLIREKMETGRSTMFVSQQRLPFYLGLAYDGRVQIGVEDDEGIPRSLLETSDETVREWVEGVYRTYRESVRRKSLEEF